MSTTYEKLGQYAGDELPAAPSDVSVDSVDNNNIVLTWTNNSSAYTESSIVIQTWQGTFWQTQGDALSYDAVGGTLSSLSEGTSYRIRVAQLLDGVLYPSQPLVQATTSIPTPVLAESGTTQTEIGVDITGYDVSWTALKMYLNDELVESIATTATTYTYTGLTQGTSYALNGVVTIDAVDYTGATVNISTEAALNPTGLYVMAVATDYIQVGWTNNNDYNGYNMIYVDDVAVTNEGDVAPDATFYLIEGLQSSTEYKLQVAYYDGATETYFWCVAPTEYYQLTN